MAGVSGRVDVHQRYMVSYACTSWNVEKGDGGCGTVHTLEKWMCVCEGGIVRTALCVHTTRLRGKSRFNLDGRNIQCIIIIHSVCYLPLVKGQVI